MKKIYIAGFDVFKKDSIQIGEKYCELCKSYGFEGLYPLDNKVDFNQPKQKIAKEIFEANKKMIDSCDIIIANLNQFRGQEADSGTIWECGYGFGLGKEVYGYMDSTVDYIDTFSNTTKGESGLIYDENGMFIEDFNHPINLMIACSVSQIMKGGFEEVLTQIKLKK